MLGINADFSVRDEMQPDGIKPVLDVAAASISVFCVQFCIIQK